MHKSHNTKFQHRGNNLKEPGSDPLADFDNLPERQVATDFFPADMDAGRSYDEKFVLLLIRSLLKMEA